MSIKSIQRQHFYTVFVDSNPRSPVHSVSDTVSVSASPTSWQEPEKPSMIVQVFLQGKLVSHIRTHHYSENHLPHKKQTSSLEEVEEAGILGLPTGPCRERSCSPTSWHLHLLDRDTVKVRHQVYPSDWGVSKRRVLMS